MSSPERPDLPSWLHELVDDRADEARRATLLEELANDETARARVNDYRALNACLRDHYAPILEEAVPAALLRAARPRALLPDLARAAALVAALLVSASAGWMLRDRQDTSRFAGATMDPVAAQAIDAHLVYAPEVRHPVEVVASERKHLVAWLSKRLGNRLDAPDLRARGFDLVGGRLLPAGGKPAAQFMYEDDGGRRITVYLRVTADGSPPSALRFAERNATGVVYWVEPPVAFALSGNLPREELEPLAREVHGQRNP